MNQAIWFRCYEYSESKIKFFECAGAKTFHELVYDVKNRHCKNPNHFVLYAEFADGYRMQIPRELYAYPNISVSQLEAEIFVCQRLISIRDNEHDIALQLKFKNQKNERCFYKDNFHEQVQDYIDTAPWIWRKEPEIINVRFTRENFQCSCGISPELHPAGLLYSIENNNVRKLCDGKIIVL